MAHCRLREILWLRETIFFAQDDETVNMEL